MIKNVVNKRNIIIIGCILVCSVILVLSLSLAKYFSTVEVDGISVAVAKPVIEIDNDLNTTDIVDGTSVIKYFTVSNYNASESTDVGLDYYLYVVNEDNELIDDVSIYYQSEDNNPNEYMLASKINDGQYTGYFKAKDFTTAKEKHEYKLVIDSVSGYNEISVKVLAVQKDVS